MNDLNFNIFNLIIISGILNGIIFSSIIFTQKKYLTNNTIYLGLTVLFLSLSNFQYWLIDTGITDKYKFLNFMFIPWQWLISPMFYMYAHKFIGRKILNIKVKTSLLIPFFIVLLIYITHISFYYSINSIQKISSHFQKGIYVYVEFFSFVFNVSIIILVYKMILKHENDRSYNIHWIKSETNWLKKLVYTGLIVCICWLIALIIVILYDLNKSYIFYPLWIGTSILVYWIGYVGLNKSAQLRKRIEFRKKRIQNIKLNNENSNRALPKAFNKVEREIIKGKMYLNPNLNLKDISEEFSLSVGYISQLINKNSKLNFNDYLNSLRVNDAKDMLTNNEYNNYTIVAIGLEAGFNSKSSFYSAFKKFTGKSPVEYKKSVRNH